MSALTGEHAVLFVVFGATVGAAIPSLANLAGIRLIGSARTAILMMLEAVVGVTMAAIFLAEEPQPIQILGGAAVLVSGAILQLPGRAEKVIAAHIHSQV